jgi:hypothetical protein
VRTRPDVLSRERGIMGEIKDTRFVFATRQLRAQIDYAGTNKLPYRLWVRPGAYVSGKLEQAVRQIHGEINPF